jgi:hypothetical protein
MRTGEDTLKLALYASECCGAEVVFEKHDCFWRCPRCQALCNWEIVDVDVEGGVAA